MFAEFWAHRLSLFKAKAIIDRSTVFVTVLEVVYKLPNHLQLAGQPYQYFLLGRLTWQFWKGRPDTPIMVCATM